MEISNKSPQFNLEVKKNKETGAPESASVKVGENTVIVSSPMTDERLSLVEIYPNNENGEPDMAANNATALYTEQLDIGPNDLEKTAVAYAEKLTSGGIDKLTSDQLNVGIGILKNAQ